jgi:hypothetical protein
MESKKPKSKPKAKPKPPQKPRFIRTASAAKTDETDETFAHVLVKIVRRRIGATGK